MLEPITGFHDMRSNPHVMIKGKASPFFVKKGEDVSAESEELKVDKKLSTEELRVLDDLQLRDTAVREEEESHARVLGRHAGAIRYEYQIGPDGRAYVINGTVEVTPKFNSQDPEEIRKVLQTIRRAAVSVSNPSQADLNIAASAMNRASTVAQRAAIEKYTEGVELQSITNPSAPSDVAIDHQLNVQA